jgi:outer membrane protein OmpA-like peptidoglycan-associated protein
MLAGLIIPAITLLIVLGSLLGYFIGAGGREPARPPAIVVQDTPAAPQQAASMPSPAPLGVAVYASAPVMVAGATQFVPPPRFEDGRKSQAGAPQQAEHFPAIHFATNRAMPVPGSWPLVENAARLIKQLPPGTVVEIGGYTDRVGSAPANMRLSQRRANAVREALIRAGVHSAILTAKGYGSSYPLALDGQNETVEGRSNALAGDRGRNDRRVELRIHPQESGALP